MTRTLMALLALAVAAPASAAAQTAPPGMSDTTDYTEVTGAAGGTVPATLSLTLGAPATFGAFVPGAAADYAASTTANVISTAGDAALAVSDASAVATGHLVNGTFSLAQPLRVKASSPAG